jgi:peroxiredoxin
MKLTSYFIVNYSVLSWSWSMVVVNSVVQLVTVLEKDGDCRWKKSGLCL